MTSARDTPEAAATTAAEDAAAQHHWMRGYLQGHEQGSAASAVTADVVQQLQAAAWNLGYDAGHRDGADTARADTARTITDLSARYAEIDESFARFGHATIAQRRAERVAEMEQHAIGQWVGLDNGAVPPSSDWEPDTSALAWQADKALAAARRYPPMTGWAQVRAYVDDRVWVRILDDLQPGQREAAIRQANTTSRNGAAA